MTELVREMFTFPPVPSRCCGFSALGQADVAPLAEAVLTVLDKVGMTCENADILAALRGAGARVDRDAGSITFPRRMVQGFVEQLRQESQQGEGGDGRFRAPAIPGLLHQLAIYTYDWERREKRLGNVADFIELTKLADVLHPEHGAGHCLLLSDVAAPVEPLEVALLLFEYAHKPAGVVVADVRQIGYVREIEGIAGIVNPYWHWLTNVSFATPLRLAREAAALFVYLVRSGDYPAKVYNFGVSGASMPVTAAGSIVLAAAEILALWMAARALNPDIGIGGNTLVQVGSIDMRGRGVSWWAFDGMMRSLAACQFLREWTGVAVSPGGGEYTPSSFPGTYVALEKAYRAMVIAAFTGYHPGIGHGHLEAGLTFSPVQLLLDRDMTAALRHLESPAIDQESIGLQTILEVGHGEQGTYMEAEHTLRHFRAALWQPQFLSRSGWRGSQGEEKVLRKAQDRVNELLSQYRKPEYDPGKLQKMRDVVERARAALA
ncbi:MAG: trimethylamine methyltransferase family protein [Anaerolineae bacterium]